MRVLVVHNRYSSRMPSGENLVAEDEVRWLRAAGVDVATHEETNDDLIDPGPVRRALDGARAIWSWSASRRFDEVLEAHRPDLVHVHNLFPLMTASVPTAALRRSVPVVWTVHNRRTTCVAGGNFRDGAPCHECRNGWRVPGIVHGCYAGSRVASGLVTAATSIYRQVARRAITPIAISEHMRDWLVDEAGFERRTTHVKYNGVAGPDDPDELRPAGRQRGVLFIGRLAGYKGVALLLEAWRSIGDVDAELRIAGDGPLADDVPSAAATDQRIVWLGQLDPPRVASEIRRARAVVVPSVWEEPFGRVATEAMASARPVLSSGRGALAEIVDDSCGWTTGTEVEALSAALRRVCTGPDDDVSTKGAAARARYEATFSPAATTAHLMEIYQAVLEHAPEPSPRIGRLHRDG